MKGIEGFKQKQWSEAQLEQKESFPQLFKIAKEFYSSGENADEDIYIAKKRLEESLDDPRKYFFMSLLNPELSTNESDYQEIDTPHDDIKKFFVMLEKRMWKKVK